MDRKFHLVALAVKAASAAVVFVATLVAIWLLGPTVETKFFPVVGKLAITKMEAVSDTETKIWAYFFKRRSCEYVGISWFKRDGDSFVRVPLQLLRQPGDVSSPNRPVGAQTSGPWIVGIPKDQIIANSYVELQHRCGFPWLSITEFYP